jgi:mevalonate kinase
MSNFLDSAILIDTGRPQETTSELVAWVKTRKTDVELPLSTIGRCTERLLAGDALHDIIRSHHQAQISLGVVPQIAQDLISELEEHGHVGKVIGAGGRRGGAGLVFALGDKNSVREIAMKHNMPILPL